MQGCLSHRVPQTPLYLPGFVQARGANPRQINTTLRYLVAVTNKSANQLCFTTEGMDCFGTVTVTLPDLAYAERACAILSSHSSSLAPCCNQVYVAGIRLTELEKTPRFEVWHMHGVSQVLYLWFQYAVLSICRCDAQEI